MVVGISFNLKCCRLSPSSFKASTLFSAVTPCAPAPCTRRYNVTFYDLNVHRRQRINLYLKKYSNWLAIDRLADLLDNVNNMAA